MEKLTYKGWLNHLGFFRLEIRRLIGLLSSKCLEDVGHPLTVNCLFWNKNFKHQTEWVGSLFKTNWVVYFPTHSQTGELPTTRHTMSLGTFIVSLDKLMDKKIQMYRNESRFRISLSWKQSWKYSQKKCYIYFLYSDTLLQASAFGQHQRLSTGPVKTLL